MELTGIILAGGKSSRMGQDKGLMTFHGVPMITYSINTLQPFCKNIIISSNNPEYSRFGYPVISDVHLNCGPLSGLHASLSYSETEWNAVISCDVPFSNQEIFNQMMAFISGRQAVVPVHEGHFEPLFAFYNKSIISIITEKIISKDYKLQNLLKNIDTHLFDTKNIPNFNTRFFSNINSQEDIQI